MSAGDRTFTRHLADPASALFDIGAVRERHDRVLEVLWKVETRTPHPPVNAFGDGEDQSRLVRVETWVPYASARLSREWLFPYNADPVTVEDALLAEGWTPPDGHPRHPALSEGTNQGDNE